MGAPVGCLDSAIRRAEDIAPAFDFHLMTQVPPLNKFIGAIIAYGPKNKTKKARMANATSRQLMPSRSRSGVAAIEPRRAGQPPSV